MSPALSQSIPDTPPADSMADNTAVTSVCIIPTIQEFLQDILNDLQRKAKCSSEDESTEVMQPAGPLKVSFRHKGLRREPVQKIQNGWIKWGSTQFTVRASGFPGVQGDFTAELWTDVPNVLTNACPYGISQSEAYKTRSDLPDSEFWNHEVFGIACCNTVITHPLSFLLDGILRSMPDEDRKMLSRKVNEEQTGALEAGFCICTDQLTGEKEVVAFKLRPSFTAVPSSADSRA